MWMSGSRLIKAYPPKEPRVPVRAGVSGVSSVHVGVRPRLHPTLSAYSIERNQPDLSIAPPLFSPARASIALPQENELFKKAQEEYENWLRKRKEREGGIGNEDDGYGTRDWQPKDRVIARPGALQVTPNNQMTATGNVQTVYSIAQPPSSASTAGSDQSPRAMTPADVADGSGPIPPSSYDPYALYHGWYDPAVFYQWANYWQSGFGHQEGEQVDPYSEPEPGTDQYDP